ncbi:hypothetical protein HG530_005115 [Fusarium avenaceum]|nr:hypothetical protein DER45DRAFT_612230 [Fusarium avenaceum]KAI6770486.1 hypothetical protein HG530_005115 [Fusarium avenaceum]
MDSSAPASSQVSEIYDAVTLLFQKLQSLSPRLSGTLDVNFTTQDGRNILSLKADVGGPKAQDDAAHSPATTFHRFRELPTEIRVMIWKLALRIPRIFRLGPSEEDLQRGSEIRMWGPILNTRKPPACAHACREPRTIFKTESKQILGLNKGIYKSFWFSPSTDIVYWDMETIPHFTPEEFGPGSPDAQNLAVDLPQEWGVNLDQLLENISSTFPDCKRLIVVMVFRPLPNHDVSFTKVKDDDKMNIPFLGDWQKWSEIQREISERYPIRHKKEKPSIEGVEVASNHDPRRINY